MSRSRRVGTLGVLAATLLAGEAVRGAETTTVSLAGRDDAIPKLGMPGIALHVQAESANGAAMVEAELARELARQVHTRRLAADEAGDYDLEVKLDTPRISGSTFTIQFDVFLKAGGGERLWHVEGRSEGEGELQDSSVYADIGRNVVAALIHDGWVQPRYDPNDPPPQPPRVRSPDGR